MLVPAGCSYSVGLGHCPSVCWGPFLSWLSEHWYVHTVTRKQTFRIV